MFAAHALFARLSRFGRRGPGLPPPPPPRGDSPCLPRDRHPRRWPTIPRCRRRAPRWRKMAPYRRPRSSRRPLRRARSGRARLSATHRPWMPQQRRRLVVLGLPPRPWRLLPASALMRSPPARRLSIRCLTRRLERRFSCAASSPAASLLPQPPPRSPPWPPPRRLGGRRNPVVRRLASRRLAHRLAYLLSCRLSPISGGLSSRPLFRSPAAASAASPATSRLARRLAPARRLAHRASPSASPAATEAAASPAASLVGVAHRLCFREPPRPGQPRGGGGELVALPPRGPRARVPGPRRLHRGHSRGPRRQPLRLRRPGRGEDLRSARGHGRMAESAPGDRCPRGPSDLRGDLNGGGIAPERAARCCARRTRAPLSRHARACAPPT